MSEPIDDETFQKLQTEAMLKNMDKHIGNIGDVLRNLNTEQRLSPEYIKQRELLRDLAQTSLEYIETFGQGKQ